VIYIHLAVICKFRSLYYHAWSCTLIRTNTCCSCPPARLSLNTVFKTGFAYYYRKTVVLPCYISKCGRAIAQAVSRRPLTAIARFRATDSPCGIFGGQNGIGAGLSPSISVFPVSVIPPWLSTLIIRGWTIGPLVAAVKRHRLVSPRRREHTLKLLNSPLVFVLLNHAISTTEFI
jgi:hypothetical protein